MVCLRDKIAVGDLPVIKDLPLPPRPDGVTVDRLGRLRAPVQGEHEDEEVFKERRQKHYAYKRLLEKVCGPTPINSLRSFFQSKQTYVLSYWIK